MMKRIMKRRFVLALGTAALLAGMLAAAPAQAEEEALKVSGFVDASFSSIEDNNGFSLDEVEIDLEKKLDNNLSARADLNYRAVDATAAGDDLSFEEIVEQGYVTYGQDKLTLTFGKFNAPIGFELLDAPDMYQYSHALVFVNGLPTNLTGVMGAYAISDILDLSLYVVNGWDVNTDNNNSRTVGGRLGITPQEGVNVGLSAISGAEQIDNTKDIRTVADIDFKITSIDKLTIGGEVNIGKEDNASAVTAGDDAEWTGFLLMAHYDFTEKNGLTIRYDYFDDKDGTRLGSGVEETRQAIALAPTFVLGNGAGALVEYRHDWSDEKVFAGADKQEDTLAVEFTYSF